MPNISPIGPRIAPAGLIDGFVNKTSNILKNLIKTNSSNLHANDMRWLFNPEAERRIYNTLAMLGYLMRLISPGTSWPGRVRQLIEECVDVDTNAMGFPANWRDFSLWSENP
jgi:hypothetical protein